MAAASSVLHGRASALRALSAGLTDAFAGRGQLALVSGEAGIGKSAVALALAHDAGARGAVVTWGRAWEFANAPPYFPVWTCLRSLGIGDDPSHLEDHDEGRAFQLWETVVSSLARVSSSGLHVWILEDLHAADLGTLDLLTFLAQPLRAMRVLVVVTMRTQDPRLTDRVTQRLTRMARDGFEVKLEPLSTEDVASLTEEIMDRTVPETALRRIVELTGGNPLFVVECARAFRAAGGIEGTLGSLPPTIRQVVLDRVALLPGAARRVLACGAVLGREFSAASVARMEESLPARIIDALLPALRAGLVTETGLGQFVFSHTLVRDAIEDALGPEERATIHAHADAALAALGDTADILVERARHALAALPSGGGTRALVVADRATELLEREGAFDRAFELHARIGDARTSGLLPPASAEKKLHMARVARAAGRSEASLRLCREVATSAREAGDGDLLGRAALLYGAEVRPGTVDRSLVALLEEARATLGDRAPHLACRVLARLACALQPAADPAIPMEMAREAMRRARETGDDALLLEVLEIAGWALVDYAPLDERIGWSNELLDRALSANDLPCALQAHTRLAFDHLEGGDFTAFDRGTETMLALSDELGHPRHRWRPLLLASARATTLGYFAESDRYVTEVAQLAALIDDPSIALSLVAHDAMRRKIQRRDDEARAVAATLESVMHGVPEAALLAAVVRATCAARMEDAEATRAELAIVGARATMLFVDPTFVAYMAESYALSGANDERQRVREVLKRARTKDIIGGHVPFTYEGTVPRLLGLLDAALGDVASAEKGLREAHALAVARGHAPWVAQTAYELARVLRRTGGAEKEREAQGLLDTCSRIARELGMKGLERSASTSVATSTSVRALATTIEREGEVWKLVRGATVVRVRDSRGVQLLAKLMGRPDEEIHVLALASDEATSVAESSAGEVLDDRARKAYRQRLAALEEEIADAERSNTARAAKLRGERDALARELARAVGLGGRARRTGSATERARVNVQRRVKDVLTRITELDEGLGRFLEGAVHTGTYCCFRP